MTVEILQGDCREILKTLEAESIDAVVCDPPYALEFMGKEWDTFPTRDDRPRKTGSGKPSNPRGFANGVQEFMKSKGMLSQYQMWCEEWAVECLRVLKPGGHLLAFGGTRTYHRLVCGIEEAGFEIRDSIHWIYGSGFPKSSNVSKSLDKLAGVEGEYGDPKSGAHAAWIDRGRMRGKEGHEGYQRPWMQDTEAVDKNAREYLPASKGAQRLRGFGTALKPSHEPIVVARKPLIGTIAKNVIQFGTGAINIDGCRVPHGEPCKPMKAQSNISSMIQQSGRHEETTELKESGRWPSNILLMHSAECDEACTCDCPVAEMDRHSDGSTTGKRSQRSRASVVEGTTFGTNNHKSVEYPGESGGASRYFPVFRYQAKASSAERKLPDGSRSDHPTVKPVALMRWLIRLVTPPGGRICDPFAGSGTTLVAASLEDFDAIGIEMDEHYCDIIRLRLGATVQAGLPLEGVS